MNMPELVFVSIADVSGGPVVVSVEAPNVMLGVTMLELVLLLNSGVEDSGMVAAGCLLYYRHCVPVVSTSPYLYG